MSEIRSGPKKNKQIQIDDISEDFKFKSILILSLINLSSKLLVIIFQLYHPRLIKKKR